jgi:hypothetical protein
MIWWILGLGGAFWAYQNGWGAFLGACPPGYVVQQDMFPSCVNSMFVAGEGLPAATLNTKPSTQPTFPMEWGWNGSTWVQVPLAPVWP